MRSTSDRGPFAAAACLFLATLWLYWPGVATYDTVAQYRQALTGAFDDWHPPVMARLWALLLPLGGDPGPMLVLQLAGYWLGLGLIGAAMAGSGRPRMGSAVVAAGLMPLFLGWHAVVLKDAQMAGALLAAVGLVAWFRLRGKATPAAAIVGCALLLGYATLARANAVFACAPLAVLLFARRRSIAARAVLAVGGIAAVLIAAPVINHRLLGASPSGVEKTQALYDLASIAVRVDDASVLTAAETAELRERKCVKSFFWDPLGDIGHCAPVMERLRAEPTARLYATLARAMMLHPLAYAAHRLAHLNSTERWLVPWWWPGAAPPQADEPNTLGLRFPGSGARAVQRVAGDLAETPLGWPFAFGVAAAILLAALWRTSGPARDMAVALLASALALEASFAVISIASDLRYHLWPMIATALAWALAGHQADRRTARAGALLLAVAIAAALIARAALPAPPQTYAAMLA